VPEDVVPLEVLGRIFRGGSEKAAEAGCAVAGGHTVIDPELKYGLCVLGTVPGKALTQIGAQPGDRLVLTKPIGFGVAAQAIKKQQLRPEDLERVVAAMAMLNRDAKDAALAAGATAATDVTGFGLLGHLNNLLKASKHAARLYADAVPILDFVPELVKQGFVPGGSRTNLAYVEGTTRFAENVSEDMRLVLADAQTSGGLLIAVRPERESQLVSELERRQTLAHSVIGEVVEGPAGEIEVRNS
jgi:selenide,water dikinase